MELVYCFMGMAILCAAMGIISGIISLILTCKDNLEQANIYLSWAESFTYCEFYFLALEIAAKFFA